MTDNDNNKEDDDRKPAAASSKLDALAEIAVAAESTEGDHSDVSTVKQQPSEVTPANTFESAASITGAASAAAASPATAAPPVAAAATASSATTAADAAPAPVRTASTSPLADTPTTSDKSCPWKNRQDLIALWKKRYAQLAAYHAENGHTNVPQRYPSNPELGRWVKDQRAFRRNDKLSKERIALLDELGFVWKLKRPDDFWKDKLEELKEYKIKHGNVNPPREGDSKLLACWVDRQRRAGKRGKLTTERVRLLNQVGFLWDPRGNDGGDGVVGCDETSTVRNSDQSHQTNPTAMLHAADSFPMNPAMGLPNLSRNANMPQAANEPTTAVADAPAFQEHMAPAQMTQGIPEHAMMNAPRMMHPMSAVPGSRMIHHSNMPASSGNDMMPGQMMPPMQSRHSTTAASGSVPGAGPTGPNMAASDMPMPTHFNRMSQGTGTAFSNHPSMQAPPGLPAYMHETMAPYGMPSHYSSMNNPAMSTSAFYPPQPHPSCSSSNYPYPSSLSRTDERQASLSRTHQLRVMLAEEEERQASITRSQQLRAMLEEEERRLSYLTTQRDQRAYDYGMYSNMEHGAPHPQALPQPHPQENGTRDPNAMGDPNATREQRDQPAEGGQPMNPQNQTQL